MIPTPFVSELQLSPADQLLLLTSDGITDVLGDDSMMEVALDALAKVSQITPAKQNRPVARRVPGWHQCLMPCCGIRWCGA